MKKSLKVLLIVAGSLVLVGAVTVISCFALVGSDIERLNTNPRDTVEYNDISESFENVVIECADEDVIILPAKDGKMRVECDESEKIFYIIATDNGTLSIKRQDLNSWYDNIGININTQKLKVVLYLPDGAYGDLSVSTYSGDIELGEVPLSGISFENITLSIDSGDIDCELKAEKSLKAASISGEISIEGPLGADIESIELKSNSGSIELENINAEKANVSASSSSGSIDLSGVNASGITLKSDSGEIELERVISSGLLEISTLSGSIEFEACDAASLELTSSSGEIEGILLSDKEFDATSKSGRVNVPASVKGAGICKCKTSSGSINIAVR